MKDLEVKLVENIQEKIDRAEEIDIVSDKKLVKKIIHELKNYMQLHEINSLSAPMIGYNKRILCIKFDDGIRAFINPLITKSFGLHLVRTKPVYVSSEYILPYHDSVIAMYQDINSVNDKNQSNRFEGLASELFQQEVNLLDGVLVSDYGLEIDENFDKASEEEREELIKAYMEILEKANQASQEEIENDPELHKMFDAVNFMTDLAEGKISMEAKETPKLTNSVLIQKNGSMMNFVKTKKPSPKTQKRK